MMEDFRLTSKEGAEILVDATVDGRVCVMIDPDPFGNTFNWQRIWLTEDETKALRRALMTAISENKLKQLEGNDESC